MKEKKLIVIKGIAKAGEMHDRALAHCRFWEVARDEPVACELTSEAMLSKSLKANNQVLAVSTATINVPLAFEVGETGGARWRVADIMHVKVDPSCAGFRDEFLGKLGAGETYYDTDLWFRLNLEAHFKNLINGQKAAMLAAHGSGAIDPAQFNVSDQIRPSLPDWCVYGRDEGLVVDSAKAPESQTWLKAIAIADKEERVDWLRKLIEFLRKQIITRWLVDAGGYLEKHPLQLICWIVAIIVAGRLGLGCLSSYNDKKAAEDTIQNIKNAAAISEASKHKPVKGSLTVRMENGAAEMAATILRKEAESFARSVISSNSGKSAAWVDGKEIVLPASAWANIITSVQRFASENSREFSCEVSSGNKIVILGKPGKLRQRVLDIVELRGDTELVALVEKAFGVRFNGRESIGPIFIRGKDESSKLDAIKTTGKIRVEWRDNGERMAFVPDLQALVGKGDKSATGLTDKELMDVADAFWTVTASSQFDSIPKKYEAVVSSYRECMANKSDDLNVLENRLSIIHDDAKDLNNVVLEFLLSIEEKPWLKYSAKMPADVNARLRDVGDTVRNLEKLQRSIGMEIDHVRFDKDVAEFCAARDSTVKICEELVSVRAAQVKRIAAVKQLGEEISLAVKLSSFDKIEPFNAKISEIKAELAKVRESEALSAGRALSSCARYDAVLGADWVAAMRGKYGSYDDLARRIPQYEEDCAGKMKALFGGQTAVDAVAKMRSMAGAIQNNGLAKSGADNPRNEADFITYCEKRVGMLVDNQRRDAQSRAEFARLLEEFDAASEAFRARKSNWIVAVGKMTSCYNAQYYRKQAILTTIAEIINAKNANDFSSVDNISARIEEFKDARMAQSADEMMVAQTARPLLDEDHVSKSFGATWLKGVQRQFYAIPEASAKIAAMAQEFEDGAVKAFCPAETRKRNLSSALKNAVAIAESLAANHSQASVPKDLASMSQTMGTAQAYAYSETALIAYAEYQFATLKRRQKKSQGR